MLNQEKAAEKLLSLLPASRGGRDAEQRKAQTAHFFTENFNVRGERIVCTDLVGVDGYAFTACFISWTAHRLSTKGIFQTGALRPIDVFGVDQLRAGCKQSGLTVSAGEQPAA